MTYRHSILNYAAVLATLAPAPGALAQSSSDNFTPFTVIEEYDQKRPPLPPHAFNPTTDIVHTTFITKCEGGSTYKFRATAVSLSLRSDSLGARNAEGYVKSTTAVLSPDGTPRMTVDLVGQSADGSDKEVGTLKLVDGPTFMVIASQDQEQKDPTYTVIDPDGKRNDKLSAQITYGAKGATRGQPSSRSDACSIILDHPMRPAEALKDHPPPGLIPDTYYITIRYGG